MVFEYFPTDSTREHDIGSYNSRIFEHVTYLGRHSMTQKRRRQSSTSNAPVPSAQSTNNSSIPENEDHVQDAELADLKTELAATKARCIEQETSIEDLKSRLSGLEKHVGSQLVLMQQSISKCVVVVTPTEASDESTQPLSCSRVFELVMSPKTNLKKVMRQAIRQYMFSNAGSIFASCNRETLGRKFFSYMCVFIIHDLFSFIESCNLQLKQDCEFK